VVPLSLRSPRAARSRLRHPGAGGDRFDDWLVGHQFEPNYLHHPVVGLKPSQAFSHFMRGNGAFALPTRLCVRLCSSKNRILRTRLCIANFRSRLGGGDRFDDWMVGRQFVPECLHHPVSGFGPLQE
jgi:hypothetical protein